MSRVTELLNRERITVDQTRASVMKWATEYSHSVIDVMFDISHISNTLNDPEVSFVFYAWMVVSEAPVDARCAFILYERGYYVQANMMVRALLEKAIILRYVLDNKGLAEKAIKPDEQIVKSHAFKATSPKLYNNYSTLSGMVHGDIQNVIPRWSAEHLGLREAGTYDAQSGSYSVNLLMAFLSIHLRLYRHIYTVPLGQHPDLVAKLDNEIIRLDTVMNSHKSSKQSVGTNDFYIAINAVTDGL